MAVVVTNTSRAILSIPLVEDTLRPGERKTYTSVEFDYFVNDSRILDLIRRHLIHVESEDAVPYASAWNGDPKFHLGDFHFWIDADDVVRFNDGDATSDSDGRPLGASNTENRVLSLHSRIGGRTFAQVRASFFNLLTNLGMGTWNDLYQYCMWSLARPQSIDWSTPQRFVTQSDLFDWMEANLPSTGGVYDDSVVHFRITELVDNEDNFPNVLVHRNSLVASMMGRRQWVFRRPPQRYGVASPFNSPSYYLNYYGELGQRFVQTATGNLPPTNNDDVVWYSNRRRAMWSTPKIGNSIQVSGLGNRGAVWDNVALAWVSPAPIGMYGLQQPFILHEYQKSRVLGISTLTGPGRRQFELNAVSALVYPAVYSGRYYGFVVYPLNGDTWSTEWVDTSKYQVQLKLVYEDSFRPTYASISPTLTSGQERHLWTHFPPGGGTSLLFPKSSGANNLWASVDQCTVPSKVYLCRRDKTTGIRSRWVPLYNVKRRVPRMAFKTEPARFHR